MGYEWEQIKQISTTVMNRIPEGHPHLPSTLTFPPPSSSLHPDPGINPNLTTPTLNAYPRPDPDPDPDTLTLTLICITNSNTYPHPRSDPNHDPDLL